MMYKVIIVDDDAITLFLHKTYIVKSGLDQEPLCYSNGQDALAFLNDSTPTVGYMMLLDINMPMLSGWDFLEALPPAVSAVIDVIIVSSSINISDYEKAKSFQSVKTYLEKPLTVEKLRMVIDSGLLTVRGKLGSG